MPSSIPFRPGQGPVDLQDVSEGLVVLTPYERALKLADGLLDQPLTDTEAIELAKVYAHLALAQAIEGAHSG